MSEINGLKNALVAYYGGGYDGCIWEWNYAYFDKEGNFHSIYHSGVHGADSKEKLQDRIEYLEDSKVGSYYIYNLDDEKESMDFVENHNEGHVIGIAKWLIENHNILIEAKCSICDELHAAYEFAPEGHESAGGVVIQATQMVCETCLACNTCAYCGEFYEDTGDFDEDRECQHCQTRNSTRDGYIDLEDFINSDYFHGAKKKSAVHEDDWTAVLLNGDVFNCENPEHIKLVKDCLDILEQAHKDRYETEYHMLEMKKEICDEALQALAKEENDSGKQIALF